MIDFFSTVILTLKLPILLLIILPLPILIWGSFWR